MFDFKRYIWQIQFHPVHLFSENRLRFIIDYLNRELIISRHWPT